MVSRFGFINKNTVLHRLNPSLKLFILIGITIGIIIYPSWVLSGLLLLLIFMGFKIAKIPLKLSRGRVRFLLLFSILLFLLQILTIQNGTILFFLIPQSGGLGPYLPVTDFGVDRGLMLSIRFLVVVFASMLFVSTTDPTLLAHSLTRLRIPYKYSFALVIALRFIPLFDFESETVRMAQKSRGISAEVRGLGKILRTIRYTFFPLLVSALSRVDALSISMDGRGFGYAKERTYLRKSGWQTNDSLFLILIFIFLLLCSLFAIGYFP